MRAHRWSMLLIAALFFSNHSLGQTPIFPESSLSEGAGCTFFRCFVALSELDDGVAVTSNAGGVVAVHTQTTGPVWDIAQLLTNPDYRTPPGPGSFRAFEGAAYRGSALLVGGTSPRYNFKDVVYVYAPSNGIWTHVQTLALQRPADYDRTMLEQIATDGVTAAMSGVRIKETIEDAAFTQVDHYLRNANGTFSRRGGFKPPIPPDRLWESELVVEGNTILLSDPGADQDAGTVLVYGFDAGRGWRLRTTLTAALRQPGARFGAHIAIDGNRIVIAAPEEKGVRPEYPGAVYIYEGSGKTWTLQQKLQAIVDPANTGYQFGNDVDISGDRVVAGKYFSMYGESDPSQAYIYERRGDAWTLVAELMEPEGSNYNESVRISGNIAMATATDWEFNPPIRVFRLPPVGTLPAATVTDE